MLSIDNTLAAVVTGIGHPRLSRLCRHHPETLGERQRIVRQVARLPQLPRRLRQHEGLSDARRHGLGTLSRLRDVAQVRRQGHGPAARQTAAADDAAASQSTFMGVGYRNRGFYYGYALGRFQRSITTARTNVTQTIVAYNTQKAGGSGHGGGFGGGSSFGGGGGGGRSR
ncbi:MAG: hypothetical protein MZW92_12450 [Comamonadaceae bacterium]|nr:hypothetical protein [Comamonadaceae bacterium]